jgi:hemoglobin
MYTLLRSSALGVLWLGLVSPNSAGESKSAAVDKAVRESLRQVIDHGADLFNLNRDPLGCYRVYQGGLLAVRPVLGHHPELQKAIEAGLQRAEQNPVASQRAFVLRKVIDEVRAKLAPAEAVRKSTKTAEEKKATLWERLGGEGNVRKVVDEFVRTAAADPKVDFSRGGKFTFTDKDIDHLKDMLVKLVSSATGGPLEYTGKDMRKSHKGMNITNAEFDATVGHLRKALDKHGAKPADAQALLKIVEGTRAQIVEQPPKGKKADGQKADGKGAPGAAQIQGKVTFQGKPLASNYVTFVDEDTNRRYSTHLKRMAVISSAHRSPMGPIELPSSRRS